MFAVITGGSGSGKSRFAEAFLQELCPGEKIYLATMQFLDEEMKERIQRHRQMRAGKQFVTIEQGMGRILRISMQYALGWKVSVRDGRRIISHRNN